MILTTRRSSSGRALHLLTLLAGLLLPAALPAQQDDAEGRRAADAIAPLQETVSWLLAYDRVAWHTSDSVMTLPDSVQARLGAEWFAFEQDGRWHALYGRYDRAGDRYVPGPHFVEVLDRGYASTTEPVDTAAVTRLARALALGAAELPPEWAAQGVRFNQYVRALPGREIEVWYLPAWQTNGVLVVGGEARLRFDREGRTVVERQIVNGRLLGVRPDSTRAISVPNEVSDYPTVGGLFFLASYRRYFKEVTVVSRKVITRLVRGSQGEVFVTAVRTDR